jgi:DNA helicase-2/ATP-dependent DNA helicase PcrA
LLEIHKELNERQREIISNPQGTKLIISGPGTGKTLTLVSYIAEVILSGYAKPEQIMAVTFTNRAADEMQERVAKEVGERVYIATLHSFAAQVLRCYPPKGYNPNFQIIDEPRQYAILAQTAKGLGLQDHPAFIKEKLTLACNLRDRNILANHNFEELYKKYVAYKKKNNLIDYDDLLVWCAYAFENYPRVLSHYQKQYRYILVDEYQDINPVQHTILKLLAQWFSWG